MNVYHLLGLELPSYLLKPIKRVERAVKYSLPWAYLSVKLDGRVSDYFEWIAAGHYTPRRDRNVMDASGQLLISDIFFGFDRTNLCFRIVTAKSALQTLTERHTIAIRFIKPHPIRIIIPHSATPRFLVGTTPSELGSDNGNGNHFSPAGPPERTEYSTIAIDTDIELLCPYEALSFKPGEELEFFIEVYEDEKLIEHYPAGLPLHFQLPVEDFEKINWQA